MSSHTIHGVGNAKMRLAGYGTSGVAPASGLAKPGRGPATVDRISLGREISLRCQSIPPMRKTCSFRSPSTR